MTRTERQRRRRRNAWLARGAVTAAGAVALVALVLVLSTPSAADADGEYIPPEATVPVVPITPETPEPEEDPAEYLAKTIYGEARGCSTTEQAAVVWCVLNRVDDESGLWPDDIVAVVTQPSQFHGYDPDHPVVPEFLALAEDVLARWEIEDTCVGDVGRVLPQEYTYFSGDGRHNYFRTEYTGGETWGWTAESPYGDVG